MSQKIYTFSVPLHDRKTLAFIEAIKAECHATGKSFSFLVLEALKLRAKND